MSEIDWKSGRRKVLGAAAGGLSLVSLAGMSSAQTEESVDTFGLGSLEIQNGKLVLPDEVQFADSLSGIPEQHQQRIQNQPGQIVSPEDVDLQKGIKKLNQAKEKGHIKIGMKDGVAVTTVTKEGIAAAKEEQDSITVQDHGQNGYEENAIAIPPNITAWTDNVNTRRVVIGTATVAFLLGAWGISGNVPAAFAGAILGLAGTVISTENQGHGVIYKAYLNPIPPLPTIIPYVAPQYSEGALPDPF